MKLYYILNVKASLQHHIQIVDLEEFSRTFYRHLTSQELQLIDSGMVMLDDQEIIKNKIK